MKNSKVKVAQSCPTLCDPMDYRVRGILQARILEWVAVPFSKGSPQPRDWTQVSTLQAIKPPEKPKNTGVGSQSLLQRIFPTQESNRGLLHCRHILYQLSYEQTWVNIFCYKIAYLNNFRKKLTASLTLFLKHMW